MADQRNQGDDHIRITKTLTKTFPDVAGVIDIGPRGLLAVLPAASTAPEAVQAIRARRAARHAIFVRSLLADEDAKLYLETRKPGDPKYEWAVKRLCGDQEK